jgi:hypothetical protein
VWRFWHKADEVALLVSGLKFGDKRTLTVLSVERFGHGCSALQFPLHPNLPIPLRKRTSNSGVLEARTRFIPGLLMVSGIVSE